MRAGENDTAREVWEAIDEHGAERIGHGVRSASDPTLMRRRAQDGILLEVRPTSNVQTGAVTSIHSHPIDALRAEGVPASLSTDCRTPSAVTTEDEYVPLSNSHHWGEADWNSAQQAAAEAAFVSGDARLQLRERIAHSRRRMQGDFTGH